MLEFDLYPLDFFNTWLTAPIVLHDETVVDFLDAVNKHAIVDDETAPYYFMKSQRWSEKEGRFRIYAENQDTFHCFVYPGDERAKNPPVYFESSLDLGIDYGIDSMSIIDENHVCVCKRFCDFIVFSLAQYICIRMEFSNTLADKVSGIVFNDPVTLDASFSPTLNPEFPAGFSPYLRDGVICVPHWGAAFLDETARSKFIEEFCPSITNEWA